MRKYPESIKIYCNSSCFTNVTLSSKLHGFYNRYFKYYRGNEKLALNDGRSKILEVHCVSSVWEFINIHLNPCFQQYGCY